MTIVDAAQRANAIDPGRSFCVTAPAGSGKTELLIQRYLALLARVERPEQVLAITFTRKAAAEMRERVVAALRAGIAQKPCTSGHEEVTRGLALKALDADRERGWQLLRDISRLNIKTIDSFCHGLTRQMPILSQFGGQARLLDDAGELYGEAVRSLFMEIESGDAVAADLAALMLHFDNSWDRLQDLLVAMLARRDQWRAYVGVHHAPEESEAYLLTTVQSLVCEELAVLSLLLAPYAAELLDLWQYAAANLGRNAPEQFPGSDVEAIENWRQLRDLLLTKDGSWRKSLTKTTGFPAGKGEAADRKQQMLALLEDLQQIDELESRLAAVSWLPEITPGSNSWQLLIHLSRLLPRLAAELLLTFQRHGAVDHTQVALSALQALGDDDDPTELALRLDYRIEHILVDEFQDTSVNQYDLLHCLTRGWGEHNAINPDRPRTIMVVGDGMQSIYGFRGANVGLFLKARQDGFNGVCLEHLELASNFRSDAGVVNWVNDSFSLAFPTVDDVYRGRVSYSPASAVRPEGAEPAVALHAFQGEESSAQEAAYIVAEIERYLREQEGSIAVLGRSRSHLQPVISRLKEASVPFAAQDMDSLADSPLVVDLETLCRALANHHDRLAWMALLRAPWCGLRLADLLQLASCGATPRFATLWRIIRDPQLQQRLSGDGRARLSRILPALARAEAGRDRLALRVWIEQAWVELGGPACAADATALEDAESFFQLLEEADREGIGLDTAWLRQQLQKRYRGGGDPDSRLQVMTLHKAKGLEFDRVFIPQLAKTPRVEGRQLLLWDEHSGADGQRAFLLAADDHSEASEATLYNYLKQQRDEKALMETTRLLYVGATRAISQLTLTCTLAFDDKKGGFRAPANRSLLAPIWPRFERQMSIHADSPASKDIAGPRPGRPLKRLANLAAEPAAEVSELRQGEGANIPERAGNFLERCVGTAIHQALEDYSTLEQLPRSPADADRLRWRQLLQGLGLWGASLDSALAVVSQSVTRTLADGAGRWILDPSHIAAASEWPLTVVDDAGACRDLVIDRSFVDSTTGMRWIIDYKSSAPQRDELSESFLQREAEHYREQLALYRDTLVAMGGSEPIRCALYFTALGLLRPMPELDWNPPVV